MTCTALNAKPSLFILDALSLTARDIDSSAEKNRRKRIAGKLLALIGAMRLSRPEALALATSLEPFVSSFEAERCRALAQATRRAIQKLGSHPPQPGESGSRRTYRRHATGIAARGH